MADTAKWVVVTGAAGSLGWPLAEHYAANGRPVLALDRAHAGLNARPGLLTRTVDITVEDDSPKIARLRARRRQRRYRF